MTTANDIGGYLVRGRGRSEHRHGRWLALLVAAFAAASLLVLSRIDHPLTRSVRWQVNDAVRPLIEAANLPVAPLRALGERVRAVAEADAEIERLKSELARAHQAMAEVTILRRSVADLAGAAHLVHEAPLPYVTARVLAASSGPGAQSIVVASGREQGVRLGFPVVNGDGLVGRVVEVGRKVSRVLLASDAASRIPVLIGNHGARAMLIGDGGATSRIERLEATVRPAVGDMVVTSSAGGFLPDGLPVGEVVAGEGTLLVKLHADLAQLAYVSVVSYDNPALGLIEAPAQPNRFAHRRSHEAEPAREGR